MSKRILGVDVGVATVGWAVVDLLEAGQLKAIDYGVITTDKSLAMSDRLLLIHKDISTLIDRYLPTEAAVESLFFFKNQKTVMGVSQSRGVIVLAAKQKGLEVFDYTPLQVKMGVAGYGRADKKQVQRLTKAILNLEEEPKPDDAADALALGITHAGMH